MDQPQNLSIGIRLSMGRSRQCLCPTWTLFDSFEQQTRILPPINTVIESLRVGFSWNREGGNNPQVSFELLDFLSTSLEITRSRPDLGGFCNFFAKSRWNLGQRCDFGSNSWYTWKTLMRFLRNLGGGLIGSIDIRFQRDDPPLNPLPSGFGGGHLSPTTIGVSSGGDWFGFRLVGQVDRVAGFGRQPYKGKLNCMHLILAYLI